VSIDLPKVQTADRPWYGRIYFDAPNFGRTDARHFHLIHESNAVSGESESPCVENGACSFARLQRNARAFFSQVHTELTGSADSDRAQAIDRQIRPRQKLGLQADITTMLVMGGKPGRERNQSSHHQILPLLRE